MGAERHRHTEAYDSAVASLHRQMPPGACSSPRMATYLLPLARHPTKASLDTERKMHYKCTVIGGERLKC
jgi:hypothetical protein